LLYLPEERIAFLGDLLFIEYLRYLPDGDPEELIRILDKVEALDARTLVTGHGPVGTAKDIALIHDYINRLQRTVEETRSLGSDPTQAAEKAIAAPFNAWKCHSFYKDNLESLFRRKSKVN
jgi:glyoxylase-like metal-dependent hydrolase (beta-lactamase superfamily II)